MSKLIAFMYLAAFILLSKGSFAQTYSLANSIRIALEKNQQLKNYKLDVASAAYGIQEAKSALLPTVDLTGQFMYYKDLPSQYAPASAFGGAEGQYTKLTMSIRQTTSANFQVSQTLYNQTALTGVKAAKVVQESSSLQEKVVREDLVYNVTATYYTIQVLDENLIRLADNIANLEKTISINSVLKDNELVSENIHNRMLINLENLRNQYENQKLLQEKNVTLLKNLMDLDISEPLAVEPFGYNEVLYESDSYDISQRPDLQLQQTQIKFAKLDKKVIAAGYYPVLSNKFSFGYTGYYNDFAPLKQINNDWIKSSYFALTLKVPVFDGFMKRNQLHQKEIQIQKNVNTLERMKANANKEMEDARDNYTANKTLLVNNKKSLDLAEKLFTSSQREYESGITSVTELLNAQNDLSSARTNYSSALLNLKLAELSLKKAAGTLLTNL